MKIVDENIPFDIFSKWFKKANAKPEIIEPSAMCLSTVDANNRPSSRMILLKKFDHKGFCFFTNLTSRKSKELAANKNVALCFYWGILGLQVRIEGVVESVSDDEADDYFASRRRESQIGAWASKQSSVLTIDQEFKDRLKKMADNFENQKVSRPPFWSGFRVAPRAIEFWQEGEFRIHNREIYTKVAQGWEVNKLYP